MKASSVVALGCLTSFVALSGLHAQYVGVSTGRTVSTVRWVSSPSAGVQVFPHDSRRGIAPAITAQWRASSWIGVTSELRYTMKGYDTTQPTIHPDYLEVPVLLRIGRLTDPHSPLTYFAEAGPALAIKAYCTARYNETTDGCTMVEYSSGSVQNLRVSRMDFSGVLGLGGAVRVRSAVVVLGARKDWGTLNMGSWFGNESLNRSSLLYVAVLWKRGGK